MGLHSPHTHAAASGLERKGFSYAELSGKQRARDHRTEPFHHEGAIEWEPGKMMGIGCRSLHGQRQQFAAKLVKPLAGLGAYGEKDGMVRIKKRAPEEASYLGAYLFKAPRADSVHLGDHGKTPANSKQAANGEMLFGLRLDAFFGGDDKQDSIDAARACEHIADKELVPWNIDEADAQRAIISCRCVERSESQIDGDAPALLLRQAIGVNTGQRADERGFAVVDVTRSSDDKRFDRLGHAGYIFR